MRSSASSISNFKYGIGQKSEFRKGPVNAINDIEIQQKEEQHQPQQEFCIPAF